MLESIFRILRLAEVAVQCCIHGRCLLNDWATRWDLDANQVSDVDEDQVISCVFGRPSESPTDLFLAAPNKPTNRYQLSPIFQGNPANHLLSSEMSLANRPS